MKASMSSRAFRFAFTLDLLLALFLLAGCGGIPQGIQQARAASMQSIQAEPTGDYFIGRRYFKRGEFKFWGYVRRPGQPWSTAQLVMLNEKQKLAPDREQLRFGFDNNYEYKLWGNFSGDKVYDAGSDGIYPEFVLKKYDLISDHPAPIFRSQYDGRMPSGTGRFHIEKPE